MSAVIGMASRSGRCWFRRPCERAHRLRPTARGEFPGATWPAGAVQLALVKQVRPGVRVRLALWATRPMCHYEVCLAELWDRIAPESYRAMAVEMAAISLRAGQ